MKSQPETPPEHQEKNLNELPSKTFKSQEFELTIYQGERKIIFRCSEIKDLSGTLYKAELTLDELHKLNDLLRGFQTIEKIFTSFFKKLDESQITIKKEDNKIMVTFTIVFLADKLEVKISLIPEKPDLNVTVMKLCDKVKEIDLLEKKIKELEKENQNLKNNLEYYHKVYLSPEQINKIKTSNIDSQILKLYDSNELNLIEKGVQKNLKKKIIKYTLLFRASRDGYKASNFHSKCDGKTNTVTLVETMTLRRFGGFTDAQWEQSSGSYKSGSNGFVFSLDNNEIYYNKDNRYNIYCHSSYGPTFGGGFDFYICDSCNSNNSSYDSSGNSYETNGKQYALAGSYNFLVRDYEVFQLELQ